MRCTTAYRRWHLRNDWTSWVVLIGSYQRQASSGCSNNPKECDFWQIDHNVPIYKFFFCWECYVSSHAFVTTALLFMVRCSAVRRQFVHIQVISCAHVTHLILQILNVFLQLNFQSLVLIVTPLSHECRVSSLWMRLWFSRRSTVLRTAVTLLMPRALLPSN